MADGETRHIEVEFTGFPQFAAADMISIITALLLTAMAAAYIILKHFMKEKAFFANKISK